MKKTENSEKKPISLDQTMSRLKDALDRWQEIPVDQKKVLNNNTHSDWLVETRSLLTRLNHQIEELSR